jgi:O-antigen ligase
MRLARVGRGSLGSGAAGRRDSWHDPVLVLMLVGAAGFGWILVEQPLLAVVAVALAFGALLLVSPLTRVVLMAFGPIVFFGGTAEFTAPKQVFLFAAGAAFVGSFLRSRGLHDSFEYRAIRPLLLASTAFFVLCGLSFVVARTGAIELKPWLRDVAPYLLFATAPYFALDAATTITVRRLQLLLGCAGLLGAFAFAVTWFNNRGITNLPITWVGFPGVLLPAALASYGTAAALQGSRRAGVWIVLAAACFGLLASTGTRSALVLLASPVAIVFAAPRGLFRRALRLSLGFPLAALAVVGLVTSVIALANANTSVLRDRRATLYESGSQVDRSYLDRLSQSRASLAAFHSARLVGTGPGVPIEWHNSFGKLESTSTVDSPLGYLAKFGFAGLVPLVVLVGSFIVFVRSLGRSPIVLTSRLALVGFGVVTVLWSLLNVPFEDKSFPVGYMLLVAIAAVELRNARTELSSGPHDAGA